jgi:hypothetical protein
MEADQKALVVAVGHGALDGSGPDLYGEGDGGFEDVEGEAAGVEGGVVVVLGPAAVMLGDGIDDGVQGGGSGKGGKPYLTGEGACGLGVVVLGDEEKVGPGIAADHGATLADNGGGGNVVAELA